MSRLFVFVVFLLCQQQVQSQGVQQGVPLQNKTLDLNLLVGANSNGSTMYGFNTSFNFEKQERFLAGMGTGVEVQRTDSFTVYAIPIFLNAHFIWMGNGSQSLYAIFRPGISLAYQAEISVNLDSIQHPTLAGQKANSAYDFLNNGFFIHTGFGYEATSGIHIEFFYRSQPSNLLNPFHARNFYGGIALGYRIR